MSTMVRSTLNPNAPLFIPAAYQQVEDFSPEWWELVKTTSWFRDHWFRQHQEQETFDGENDEDVTTLLPDSFDLGITDDFSNLDYLDEAAFHAAFDVIEQPLSHGFSGLKKSETDADSLMRNLSLKSPRNGVVKPAVEPIMHYHEKPLQYTSPKMSHRRIIQQPR